MESAEANQSAKIVPTGTETSGVGNRGSAEAGVNSNLAKVSSRVLRNPEWSQSS